MTSPASDDSPATGDQAPIAASPVQPPFAGAYDFPDNSRRRIPGVLYLLVALGCAVVWFARRDDSVLINRGMILAAVVLAAAGILSISSGWRMTLDETDALVIAGKAARFPAGLASAQQVWRGVRSRPTWRVLVYSAEDEPRQRALVLVDAVDGRVLKCLVEDNPEAGEPS